MAFNARQNQTNNKGLSPAHGNSGVRYTDSTATVAQAITKPGPVWQTGKPERTAGKNFGTRSGMCKGCSK